MRLTSDGRLIVAVHVEYFRELGGAVYTVAYPDPERPGETKGEHHVVEGWVEGLSACWVYALMHATMAAIEAGYDPEQFVVRGDRQDLPRLLAMAWPGKLGQAVALFREKFPGVRAQHRVGKPLPPREQAALLEVYRAVLLEHQASQAGAQDG
jgi:hypothetical protein